MKVFHFSLFSGNISEADSAKFNKITSLHGKQVVSLENIVRILYR